MALFEQGLVVADRFRLEEPLGKGGMGEVWLAHHLTLDIPCAIKFIREDKVTERTMMRFRQEARSAAKLRSPNVVQMLDYGDWEGSAYIAMELLEGEPLSDRLKREQRLSTGKTLALIRDVGRALSRAGELSIVHRDLKPDNLFIVKDADREIVKVLDFGVAKVPIADVTQQQTQTGALVGTPYYMSPEQAQGDKKIDARSDLWSLAVITFACLTGRLPFKATGLGSLLKQIMLAPLPVPTELAPDLPKGFDKWWAKATQRDPDERFQSAEDMVQALEVALVGKPDTDTTFPDGSKNAPVANAVSHAETLPFLENTTNAPLSNDAKPFSSEEVSPPPVDKPGRSYLAPAAAVVVVGGGLLYAAGVFGPDRASDPQPAALTGETAPAITTATATATAAPAATVTATASATASASVSASAVAATASVPRWRPKVPVSPKPKPKPKPKELNPGY